jgi:hypothetical protein
MSLKWNAYAGSSMMSSRTVLRHAIPIGAMSRGLPISPNSNATVAERAPTFVQIAAE